MEIKGIKITQDVINRFYSKIYSIESGENKGCWHIDLIGNNNGYKVFSINSINVVSSRLMFVIHNPNVNIDDMHICHKCDNRWCVNPDHLFVGTAQDNINDKINKNRQAKGETCGTSVLCESDVIEILDGVLNNKFNSASEISRFYLIGITTIFNIIDGNTWTHITKNYDLKKIKKIIQNSNKYKAKLTPSDVEDIRKRLQNKESCASISRLYNVSSMMISCIKNNKKHIK